MSSKKKTTDAEANKANTIMQQATYALDTSIATYKFGVKEPNLPELNPSPEEPAIEHKIFKIRIASSGQPLTTANLLIQEKFSSRGYSTTDINRKENQDRITLLVNLNNIITGTITLGLDTHLGLDVDKTFKAEVDQLRANGRKLAELTNLAMEGGTFNEQIFASLIHVAFIYARRIHNYSDLVIEVHRHSTYYQKMLGFRP